MSYKTLPISKLTGIFFSLRCHYDNGIKDAEQGLPPRHSFDKINEFTQSYKEGYESVGTTVIKKKRGKK